MTTSPPTRPATHPAPDDTGLRRRLAGVDPRRWALWSLPRPALAYVLAVDLVALVVVVAALPGSARALDWAIVGLLLLGSVIHAEAARHIERIRDRRMDRPFIDLKSMWSFAGLLLVPLGPALVLVIATFCYWWLRSCLDVPPHRPTFSCSTVVLGTATAGLLLPDVERSTLLAFASGPTGVVLIALAACARWAVNHGLVVGVILLVSPNPGTRQALASPTDTLLGLGALALGAALAVLAAASPWLVPILLVPVITLHRGVLLDQFRHAARTDAKTGLANGPAWIEAAEKEVARARRHGTGLAVLMVDLDEFKAVNDAHGHLAGDEVLRAIAHALTAEVRAYDAVGRFGGEEFVVLLPGVDPDGALLTAERLRARIAAIDLVLPGATGPGSRVRGLSASIGCASCPGVASTVDALMAAADGALYEAKRTGRDRVVAAPPACLPPA